MTLRNPTPVRVELRPCPSYLLGLYGIGLNAVHTYRLNWDDVRSIAPHGGVRYAMQAVVPAGAEGLAKLAWRLNGRRIPTAVAVLAVDSATSP